MKAIILIYSLIGLASFVVLWLLFVLVFWLRDHKEKVPAWLHKPIYALVVVGYVLDALFNIVFASVMFWCKPDFAGARVKFLPTLSERLRDILKLKTAIKKDSYRYRLALFMCRYIIEPYDNNHCGLSDL